VKLHEGDTQSVNVEGRREKSGSRKREKEWKIKTHPQLVNEIHQAPATTLCVRKQSKDGGATGGKGGKG
jgi:hypothetical protein